MKYETLEELVEAYEIGELDEENPIYLDNDCSFVYEIRDEDSGQVFNGGGPRELLEQALELLGIPWEPV